MGDPRPLQGLTITLASGRGADPHMGLHLSTNFGLALSLGYYEADMAENESESRWIAYLQSPCCQSDIRMRRPARRPEDSRGSLPRRYCAKCRESVNHSGRGFTVKRKAIPTARLEALAENLDPITAILAVERVRELLEWIALRSPQWDPIRHFEAAPLEETLNGLF